MHIGVVDGALKVLMEKNDTATRQEFSAIDRSCPAMNDKPSSKLPPLKAKTQSVADGSGKKMNPAFDSWLEDKLHNMFDSVASEPLPQDLLKLLDELDKKTGSSSNSDDKKSGK
jgi:hypothetical protein